MSYRLRDGVYMTEGALRGAILDTNTKNVYSINETARLIISNKLQNDNYWEQLVDKGLAEISEETSTNQIEKSKDINKLEFVWFEVVTDDCNERCMHCYADSMPETYRGRIDPIKNGFGLEPENAKPVRKRMRHSDWINAMRESYDLGCKDAQLIGGEPFLYKGNGGETLLDLAQYLVNLGFKSVEIYTNGTLLSPDKVSRIKELGLKVAISLYSSEESVHDQITRTPGSYAKTTKGIRRLKEAGVPLRVETVLMKANQSTIDQTMEFRDQLSLGGRLPDPLRPSGRGNEKDFRPDLEYLIKYGLILKPNFKADSVSIAKFSTGHSCLLGKLAITEFGDVLPCIFSRNNVVGNVLEASSLKSIVKAPSLTRIWSTTKDDVMVCKDCEYRYVCSDCRPLSKSTFGDKASYQSAPYPRCTYNPYSGEWSRGLWQIDSNGNLYYDRTIAGDIDRTISTSLSNQTKLDKKGGEKNGYAAEHSC